MKMLNNNLLSLLVLCVLISLFLACGEKGANVKDTNTNEVTSATPKKEDIDDGYPAPPQKIVDEDFKLLDGKSFNLKSSKGKVVLINLWATWCGPCRKEMPELVAMQDEYRDKGFEIIGLDTDPETDAEITAFAKKMKLNYKLGWASREMVSEFFKLGQMNGIPQSFLINRRGKLTGIFQGGSNRVIKKMRETVDKIVNE